MQADCASPSVPQLKHSFTSLRADLRLQGMADIENDVSVGFQLISTDDIDDYGVAAIIKRIRDRVGDSPVYLRYVV